MNKQKTTFIYLIFLSIIAFLINACQKPFVINAYQKPDEVSTPQPGEDPVEKVIKALTLEEKAALVVGTGMRMFAPPPTAAQNTSDTTSPGGPLAAPSDTMFGLTDVLVPGAAGTTFKLERLGITPMVLADGPAGLRIRPTRQDDENTYYCTAFPVATTMASTWDTELVYKVGEAMGNEVLEYGADVLLAPGLNLHRLPLCGRNFEYYSEDPHLSGKIAAAMIKGVQSQGVGTSIKHYVANNQEWNRASVNVIVSERALRELYLEGFRIAVDEAQPWTVMSSYNKVNGPYTSENHDLLTKILRDDWGFEGFVMTDWGGGADPIAQMIAGNDLLMPGNSEQSDTIVKAVQAGTLDEAILDKNIQKILNIVVKTPRFKGYEYSNNPDLKAHAEVTRQAATDGMVLLKNNNQALPLKANLNVAAYGNTSYEIIIGGRGTGDVNEAYSVALIEGLENGGYIVYKDLENTYLKYIEEEREKQRQQQPEGGFSFFRGRPPIAEMVVNDGLINKTAEEADIALITIGRNSGEGRDRAAEPGDFYLTDMEKALIQSVSKAFQAKDKKAIVVLNIGGVIETASWRDYPDAILLAWQPGQEAGNSIVDVISGKVNPSGKLANTFPIVFDDIPAGKNFPGIELEEPKESEEQVSPFGRRRIPAEVVYEEDIYVGYRYFNTFDTPVAYEFGYGLSYSTFDYSNIALSSEKFEKKLTITVDVTNTGDVAGREVVQVYLHAPENKLDKPEEELVAFDKTKLLQPGETETLAFELIPIDLTSYDESATAWVAEAGDYEVRIGASSLDIKQKASFNLAKDQIVEKVTQAAVPTRKINKMFP